MVPRRTAATGITVCLVIVLASVGGGLIAGAATAQDDSPPPLPASYYGNLTLSDGEIDQRVRVKAVADGEVQDTIITDQTGAIGGPTVSDNKLDVQQPDDEVVEFQIDGEPAEIAGGNVQTAENRNDAVVWESGTQKIELEVDPEDLEPSLDVAITNTTTPVEEGDKITVNVSITNNGPVQTTQTIELKDFNNNSVDSEVRSLSIDETSDISLQWDTDQNEVVNDTTDLLTVQVDNRSYSTEVEIERRTIPEVAPEPDADDGLGGNGGGGGGGSDVTSPDNNTNETTGASLPSETQEIVSDKQLEISQVRFTNRRSIASITWFESILNGTVTVRRSNMSSNNTANVPGTPLNLSNVTAPSRITSNSGVVQFRISPERMSQIGVNASNLQVYTLINNTWQSLPTEVNRVTEQDVFVEAETDTYSTLAVTGVSKPEAIVTTPNQLTAGEIGTFDATASSDQLGTITSFRWIINGQEYTGEMVETSFDDTGEISGELIIENAAGETAATNFSFSVEPNESTSNTPTETESEGMPGFSAIIAIIALISVALLSRVE